jgi:DNA-binding PadR family transcriptional regulator
MNDSTFFVLAALADERRHGYGIVEHTRALSSGGVRLTTGTLYGMLERLTASGLIAADGDEVVQGRLRRYYRLTEAGAQTLHEQTRQMRRAASVADRQLRLRERLA